MGAEPWLVGGWGYGLWSPCRNAWGAAVPCAGKKKRDADAQLIYGAGLPALGYGYGAPILTIKSDCKNAYGLPVPCAAETPAERPLPLRSRRGALTLMLSSTSALDGHGDPLSTLPTWASAPTLLANRFHANSDQPQKALIRQGNKTLQSSL